MSANQRVKVAVIGSGRMGAVVGKQLPDFAEKLIIDTNEEAAMNCANTIGCSYSTQLSAAADADIVAMVVPAPAIPSVSAELAAIMKDGAILMNMATAATIDQAFRDAHSALHIVDSKIIGNAMAITKGNAPGCVIVGTEDALLFDRIASVLPGFTKVMQGDASLVSTISDIATKEALRCGLIIKEQLRSYNVPDDVIEIAMYSVGGGTLQAQAVGNLGGYALKLIEELQSK